MPDVQTIRQTLERMETYLHTKLLPFWLDNSPDPAYGGVLSYFDRYGKPTGETDKPFLMQIRMLYTLSSVLRFGFGDERVARLAGEQARFIREHYWDEEFGGWYWMADRSGKVFGDDKVGYVQCFGVYAYSEYFLASGDPLGKEMAVKSYEAICANMIDTRNGGFVELMDREWRLKPGGIYGGDRKSLDVHMHMMEALTSFYEMTGRESHRRRLLEVIDLIIQKMLHPQNRLGMIQFTFDFQPLRRIIFATEWGRDARPAEEAAPIDQTSPGHNVEFAWLLLHAADVMGMEREHYAEIARPQFDHCVRYGIDAEFGGVYADTPMEHPTTQTEKQFWQQAEVLVAMLDAYALLGDERYWDGFMNVYHFVFNKMVAMDAGGEWYERLNREGEPVDAVLGHAWKINYHTVRSMVQSILRLRQLVAAKGG